VHAASEHLFRVGLTGEHLFAGRVGVRDLEHGVLEVPGIVVALSRQQLPEFIVSAVAVRGVGRPTLPDATFTGRATDVELSCVSVGDDIDPGDGRQRPVPRRNTLSGGSVCRKSSRWGRGICGGRSMSTWSTTTRSGTTKAWATGWSTRASLRTAWVRSEGGHGLAVYSRFITGRWPKRVI